ncbi:MAG: UDPglucose--hexose-phosphate uridylyltransferase [Campylobacterota bacterium]|nr:UDPglucose--hexose-phosphate uridylyltransferase [Campylobacterota bacterium]
MSHFRYCKITDNWVIIAKNRQYRPSYLNKQDVLESVDIKECPFEHDKEELTPQEIFSIKNYDEKTNKHIWKTRVVPNLYNALDIKLTKESSAEGIFEKFSGLGAHEIIIDTPNHNHTMDLYTLDEYQAYIHTIIHRVADLQKDLRLEYIQVFKNHGTDAGATQRHPHTQLIATPFIPKEIARIIENKREYFIKHNRSLVGDLANEELRERKRVVFENDTFVAFAPFASAFAFEIMIVPKQHISSIIHLSNPQIVDLSEVLQVVFKKYAQMLGLFFPFNLLIFNAPPKREQNRADYYHKMDELFRFYIRITPRVYKMAGFELSSGMNINPIAPELVAEKMNKVNL